MPSPRGDGLYALLCPRGSNANPRLRFDSRDLAEAGGKTPLGWRSEGAARSSVPAVGFWSLAGADLSLAAPPAIQAAQAPAALEADLEADLASIGLGLRCLAPRLGGAAALAAAGLGARLRLPWGSLGAWSSSRWQRLRAGRLFRGDAAGGCAFLIAEIEADALDIIDLEGNRNLRLAPHANRRLELEVEPSEPVLAFAAEAPKRVSVG
ncbi:MAG TPA: hypothetical protein VGS22_04595 [Thermoanaerobaculia bacterium]|nr:hypothetical protein [Thermoanaerobaculia bacterium]